MRISKLHLNDFPLLVVENSNANYCDGEKFNYLFINPNCSDLIDENFFKHHHYSADFDTHRVDCTDDCIILNGKTVNIMMVWSQNFDGWKIFLCEYTRLNWFYLADVDDGDVKMELICQLFSRPGWDCQKLEIPSDN